MFIDLAAHDKNRKQKFLEEMEREIPWDFIVEEISKYWEESKIGRKKYPLEKMLKINCFTRVQCCTLNHLLPGNHQQS